MREKIEGSDNRYKDNRYKRFFKRVIRILKSEIKKKREKWGNDYKRTRRK